MQENSSWIHRKQSCQLGCRNDFMSTTQGSTEGAIQMLKMCINSSSSLSSANICRKCVNIGLVLNRTVQFEYIIEIALYIGNLS